jgi:hypothetical protein
MFKLPTRSENCSRCGKPLLFNEKWVKVMMNRYGRWFHEECFSFEDDIVYD